MKRDRYSSLPSSTHPLQRVKRKWRNSYQILSLLSGGRLTIALISLVLPSLVMIGFGLFLAFKFGYLIELSATILILTVLTSLPLYWLHYRRQKQASMAAETDEGPDHLVTPSSDWSEVEIRIWKQSKAFNRALVSAHPEWDYLPQAAIEVMSDIAMQFDKKALDFTVPEALKLLEEVSRRYSKVLDHYGVMLDKLSVAQLKNIYDLYQKYGGLSEKVINGAIWLNHAKNLFVNPAKVALDLAKQGAMDQMSQGWSDQLSDKALIALLDEIASVAIDLYSGRFSFDEAQVTASAISTEDRQRRMAELEPLRLVLVGQISSGKSSFINQFRNQVSAEVDILPSTEGFNVYDMVFESIPLHIVDSQGLTGDDAHQKRVLNEMVQADLVIWLMRANQPARHYDQLLKTEFDAFYQQKANRSRLRPKVIGVLNQVDRLKPVEEWQPPYLATSPVTPKWQSIQEALAYNQSIMHFDAIFPLALPPDKPHDGLDELKQFLTQTIEHAASVQRNRQRVETREKKTSWTTQWKRGWHIVSGRKQP